MVLLAIGAHPDDVELGCYGVLALQKHTVPNDTNSPRRQEVHILVATNGDAGGETEKRMIEARASAAIIGAVIHFGGLTDTLVTDGRETIDMIERYIKQIQPDMIMVNSPHDTHQDHRNLAKAVISATRYGPDRVYFYETPTTTQKFHPSLFYDISEVIDTKCAAVGCHNTQNTKPYMSSDIIKALARYRALKIGKFTSWVEAYEPHKLIIKL